jgi:uncharacterized protein (DUF2147 family)
MKHNPQMFLFQRHDVNWKHVFTFLFFIAVCCTPGRLLFAATPIGLWYAEGGAAQVEIRECDTALCGRVVWLHSPLDTQGCELRDENNPDATLRNRILLGLKILHGLTSSDSEGKEWTGGTVYDPASGKTYRCSLMLDGEHRLHLRGYIGIPLIGRTTTWVRVGTGHQHCQQ